MDGRSVSLTGRPLTLLAGLLVHANTTVSTDRIEYWLWDEDATAPKRAKNAIQTYVMRLRQAFGDERVVRTVAGGYRLDADETTLDLLRFESLAAHDDAASLRAAVDLWRGPALTGVPSDTLQRDEAQRLGERHLDAWERLIDTLLAAGETPHVRLRALTAEHPLRERFWEQLVTALHRAGRQADALAAYRQAAEALAEEAGLDPGPGLRALPERVLAGEPLPATADPWMAPHQLPRDTDGFTGRAADLAALPAEPALVAVEGTAGVGKTALVVRFAHQVADRFPDGQVYVNLRGYGPGEPRDLRSALELLLTAVGVRPDQMPTDETAREALWRSRTSGRRMVVVLDNARSTSHVRPLLPGRGSLVLVTSRTELRGLVARDGARRHSLARLDPAEARDLLADAIGAARVEADREGSDAFLARCAYLPLAIRILGERASRYPAASLTEFLTGGLAGFDLDDDEETDLRAVFAPSYHGLCDEAAALFRLLGGHPGAEFGVPVAAALLDVPQDRARFLLNELVRAHLLEEHRPGRYEFHDLLREYAAELLREKGDEGGTAPLDWYTGAALAAFRAHGVAVNVVGIDVEPAIEVADQAAAIAWYETEWANLVAAVQYAHANGHDVRAWQIARLLQSFFIAGGHHGDLLMTHTLGLASARRLGDLRATCYMLNGLGITHSRMNENEVAIDCFEERLAGARQLGDLPGVRSALTNLIVPYRRTGRYADALRAAQDAEVIGREISTPGQRSLLLSNLAEVYLAMDDPEQAVAQARRAYDLAADGPALRCLGRGCAALGRLAEGADYLARAVAWFQDRDAEFDIADSLRRLGSVRASMGDTAGASEAWLAALAGFERIGHPDAAGVRAALADAGHTP